MPTPQLSSALSAEESDEEVVEGLFGDQEVDASGFYENASDNEMGSDQDESESGSVDQDEQDLMALDAAGEDDDLESVEDLGESGDFDLLMGDEDVEDAKIQMAFSDSNSELNSDAEPEGDFDLDSDDEDDQDEDAENLDEAQPHISGENVLNGIENESVLHEDMAVMNVKIQEIIKVLNNFAELREEGRYLHVALSFLYLDTRLSGVAYGNNSSSCDSQYQP